MEKQISRIFIESRERKPKPSSFFEGGVHLTLDEALKQKSPETRFLLEIVVDTPRTFENFFQKTYITGRKGHEFQVSNIYDSDTGNPLYNPELIMDRADLSNLSTWINLYITQLKIDERKKRLGLKEDPISIRLPYMG